MSYEKGARLERLVAKILEAQGYKVSHDVWLVGRSGVRHQIDVYAEFEGPLHRTRIIVECKAYEQPVGKEIVQKLIQEIEDLGVEKGILATTSRFTRDAIELAKGFPIELWDKHKLAELVQELLREEEEERRIEEMEVYHIAPKASVKPWKIKFRDRLLAAKVVYFPIIELVGERLVPKGFILKREVIQRLRIPINGVSGRYLTYRRGLKDFVPKNFNSEAFTKVRAITEMRREGEPLKYEIIPWRADVRKVERELEKLGIIVKGYKLIYYPFYLMKLRRKSLIPLMAGEEEEIAIIDLVHGHKLGKGSVRESLLNLVLVGAIDI